MRKIYKPFLTPALFFIQAFRKRNSGITSLTYRKSKGKILQLYCLTGIIFIVITGNALRSKNRLRDFQNTSETSNPKTPTNTILYPFFAKRDVEIIKQSAFILSKSSKHGFSSRAVFICPITSHLYEFYKNLLCHFQRVMPQIKVVIIALDEDMSRKAELDNVATVPLHAPISTNGSSMYTYRSQNFNTLSKLKLIAMRNVLALGIDAILLDADVIFCDDVREKMIQELLYLTPKADMLLQNNLGKEQSKDRCMFNTGFYYTRHSRKVLKLFSEMVKESFLSFSAEMNDQDLFHRFMCRTTEGVSFGGRSKVAGDLTRPRCFSNYGVIGQALPLQLFPNGKKDVWEQDREFSLRQACKSKSIVLFHANYRNGTDKQQFLESQGLWLLSSDSNSCQEL